MQVCPVVLCSVRRRRSLERSRSLHYASLLCRSSSLLLSPFLFLDSSSRTRPSTDRISDQGRAQGTRPASYFRVLSGLRAGRCQVRCVVPSTALLSWEGLRGLKGEKGNPPSASICFLSFISGRMLGRWALFPCCSPALRARSPVLPGKGFTRPRSSVDGATQCEPLREKIGRSADQVSRRNV